MAEYPLDWTTLPHDKTLYEADIDLSGPIADYEAHLSVVRDAAAQLPADLTALLTDSSAGSTFSPPRSRWSR
ncbi:hypothetical protein [Streptomyces sp. NRRL F-2747]|uniref:hypothetical protein n=1 Tax=Streptomyces sp. NRRL F-2747 TaxID=1463843 RepID=UPI000A7AD627|nr:hypothetical protein [Streptomyces sp. NRRL F-2747]